MLQSHMMLPAIWLSKNSVTNIDEVGKISVLPLTYSNVHKVIVGFSFKMVIVVVILQTHYIKVGCYDNISKTNNRLVSTSRDMCCYRDTVDGGELQLLPTSTELLLKVELGKVSDVMSYARGYSDHVSSDWDIV